MIASGIAQIIFGLSPILFLTAAMNFLIPAMIPVMSAHSQTIWQTQTPRVSPQSKPEFPNARLRYAIMCV